MHILGIFCCCYVALWDSKASPWHACERVSDCVETSPPSRLPPQDRSPSLNPLSLFSSFIFCPTSFQRDRAAFLDVWCSLPVFRSCFVEVVQMIFWWESDLPFLFLCHLGTTPPGFLHREFYEHRGLIGYSPWGHKELDTTEWLSYTHTHTHAHTKGKRKKKQTLIVQNYNIPCSIPNRSYEGKKSVRIQKTYSV